MKQERLNELLQGRSDLSEDQVQKILQYYQLVIEENQVQNLTRLTEPQDFYDGHLLDVFEFLKVVGPGPKADIGSGAGVPGLVCALLRNDPWQLWESETRKADFLKRCVDTLGLGTQVNVIDGRVETDPAKKDTLCEKRIFTFRAVGKIDKIYRWVRSSFTWNQLVLFKGPQWESEWAAFPYKKDLEIEFLHKYEVGTEKKQRILVGLKRTQARST